MDGYIEPIYLEDGTVVVGNEEAKLRGMAGNRRLGDSILAGPFFVCGEDDGEFRLTNLTGILKNYVENQLNP